MKRYARAADRSESNGPKTRVWSEIRREIGPSALVIALMCNTIVARSVRAAPEGVAAKAAVGSAPATPIERYQNLELFQKVLHFVETNYVDEVQNKALIQGAIKGMLETLDPHSNFLPPEIYKDMKVDTSGKFGGLGIEIGMKENVLTVVAPIEDTPAWKAGVKPGDRVLKIDGESTKGMTLIEAVAKMRGAKGSAVQLLILRDGQDKPREISITRDIVKIVSVKSDLVEPRYGYVRLSNFNENAALDVKNAIAKLEAKGPLAGLVFDLRTNPGGLLDQAVEVASLFIDDGVIVSTIGRNREQKEVKMARKGNARRDLPVAVLVNSSSASAAEIVAGAIQDHRRGIIMGTPTFGKGSVQTVVDLGQDMGLKLTIARYYTPSGRSIQEKGVQPDIILEDFDPKLLADARRKGEATRERDLKRHMANPDGKSGGPDADKKEDFRPEEIAALGKGKGAKGSKTGKDGAKSDKDGEFDDDYDFTSPTRFDAKQDYQVREAVNYLKSYDLFRKIAAGEGKELAGDADRKAASQ